MSTSSPKFLSNGVGSSSPLVHDFTSCPCELCSSILASISTTIQLPISPTRYRSTIPISSAWSSNSNTPMCENGGQETCQEEPQDAFQYHEASPLIQFGSSLDQQSSPTSCDFNMSFIDYTAESFPTDPFNTFGQISTIATKNERRKAQNRAAQRAFRIRQQQALTEATSKMRSMQEELNNAISSKEHFERLFNNLSVEHERLLNKLEEALASSTSSPSSA